jgi:hypothetical protein
MKAALRKLIEKFKKSYSEGRMRPYIMILVAVVLFAGAASVVYYVKFSGKVFSVGDRGPGGGWVFYDKGDYIDGWRYLEAGPEDLCLSVKWDNGKSILTDATETVLGSGKSNTEKIIKAQGDGRYAAKLCDEYTNNMKSDWYLPSIDELELMFEILFKKDIGNYSNLYYWSSTEYNASGVKTWYFKKEQQYASRNGKTFRPNAVRPVRSF